MFNFYFRLRSTFKWESGSSLKALGCNASEKFTLVLHGFHNATVGPVIEKFLKYRGGCVIFVDYAKCIAMKNYFKTLLTWKSVVPVVAQRLTDMEKDGIPSGNILLYAFSLGTRIAVEAALMFGKGKLEALDRGFV